MRKEQIESMFRYFCLAFILVWSIPACQVFDQPNDRVVITVDDTKITKAELNKDIKRIIYDMGMSEEEATLSIKSIIGELTEKYLIMEYGKEEGIILQDDELNTAIGEIKKDYPEDTFDKMLLERYIDYNTWEEEFRQDLLNKKIMTRVFEVMPSVSFNETMAYFELHRNEFISPQMVQLRQIVTESKEDAEKILDRLSKGDDMEKLAKEYSITPEAKNGGNLGWISKGELEEDMEEVVFALPINKTSPVFKSSYGYHIFEVLSVSDERLKTLPEVKAEIESTITLQKREAFYSEWLEGLKDRFPVTIDEEIYNDWNTEG
jgi:peptidyl-prolyl cis-trans isomerase C